MNSIIGKINKIIHFSVVDGPGSRLVIFLQGCNYNCINCHNPHTINHCNSCQECVVTCPPSALQTIDEQQPPKYSTDICIGCDTCISLCPINSDPRISEISVTEMLTEISKYASFIEGITVSGGEATLQFKFVKSLFEAIKQDTHLSHLSCFIDTNGSLQVDKWRQLIDVTDGVMVDLKAWDQQVHLKLTGKSNHKVKETIKYLAKHNKLYEVRLLEIPTVTDYLLRIDEMASWLHQHASGVKIRINGFRHHGVTGKALALPQATKQDTNSLKLSLQQHQFEDICISGAFI
ncbi:YjjW family glycine radical enzyme activase [Shewanella marina]|uniref:YjjW family glycine radical enzyme activase n=1 Tax=Shewanella marina TaxID=487319 RepID=UPI00046F1AA8|nr:YjjW family glycine radical enzyme activase [Shewanella marina]